MSKIGVFVCHCGENIAKMVDCPKVAEVALTMQGVAHAEDYKYMCSDPGQERIKKAIREKGLTGIVVVACSPSMHEMTFRRAAAEAGINPYLCEMANVREQCSWVHEDREKATEKAIALIRMMVEKTRRNTSLKDINIPLTKRALVVGGGVAGIQVALDIAAGGHEVVLVEKSPSIGGHMAQLSETFPTLDCSQCILTPKMVEAASHPKITLMTYSEVEEVDGFIGNFKVKVKQKARSINMKKCTGCGVCMEKCPVKDVPSEFDSGLSKRRAIYTPSPQAVPNKPAIDREHCIYFKTGKCGLCQKVCGPKAIDYDQKDEIVELDVGAIVMAIGFDLYNITKKEEGSKIKGYGEYGYGKFADVIDGLQFERLASASGPTNGEIRRPSDGKVVEKIIFIQCVGSRNPEKGMSYCSKICCMYTAKQALLYKHKNHNGQAHVFYMDIRSAGKNYDEFVRRTIQDDKVNYIRGTVSRIFMQGGKLFARGIDTLSNSTLEIEADMIVLATAVKAQDGIESISQKLRLACDKDNFLSEAHPKLRPVETNTAGVYLAGACQAPKDIPETVSQASAAASKILGLFSNDELTREPIVASVNENDCIGCLACLEACPYKAIEEKEIKDRNGNVIKIVASVNEGVCQGCGICVSACRSGCVSLAGFTDEQIYSQINSIWTDED